MALYEFGLGVGLAYVAGIRSWFPLLMVGLISRYADKFPLQPGFGFLATLPVLLLLIIFMGYEVLAWRAIGYNESHGSLQLGLKIIAGGILFTAFFPGFGNFLGFIFGGFVAALSHAIIVYFGLPGERPGFPGNSSNLLDALAVAGTVMIILLPWLSLIIWGLLLYVFARRLRQNHRYSASRRTRTWR